MSGDSGTEMGGPMYAKEYDENATCRNCGHPNKEHTPGCTRCSCTKFRI